MADTLQFDLVSPERKLASLEATSVQIPGMSGDFTAMPNHALVSKPATPASCMVGTFGSFASRVGPLVASARNLPAVICGSTDGM